MPVYTKLVVQPRSVPTNSVDAYIVPAGKTVVLRSIVIQCTDLAIATLVTIRHLVPGGNFDLIRVAVPVGEWRIVELRHAMNAGDTLRILKGATGTANIAVTAYELTA